MKKIHIDVTANNEALSVFAKDTEIIFTGTTIYSMPVKEKNSEYKRFADKYDVQFIFDDNNVQADFYTIPRVDIFAADSLGGFIATVGNITDMESDAPICYIDMNRKTFLIADTFREFINKVDSWKSDMKIYDKVSVFNSKEETEEMLGTEIYTDVNMRCL